MVFRVRPEQQIVLKKLSAFAEKRSEPKNAQETRDETMPSVKKKSERQHLIPIVDSSVPDISTVFSKNTASKQTVVAEEIVSRKERNITAA